MLCCRRKLTILQTDRQLVLLYMLMQLVLSSPKYKKDVEHASAAWTPFLGELLSSDVGLRDWIWVDALLRSRSFDLSHSEVSMIPCLDLANHSISYTAYWRQDVNNEAVTLFLPKESSVPAGEGITINYGKDKPAAEMLFNYEFIDSSSVVESLVLLLDEVLEEATVDPLLEAKLRVSNVAPMLDLRIDNKGNTRCYFLHLMCVHEQDGLAFRTEERQGYQSPRMLWRGKDSQASPAGSMFL